MKSSLLILSVFFLTATGMAQLYEENSTALINVSDGDGVWADLDNDGDMDIILTGLLDDGTTPATAVYVNDAFVFTEVSTIIPGLVNSDIDLADFDNDGLVDLAICGTEISTGVCQIWRNTGSGFDLVQSLTGIKKGTLAWADVDNDGDTDLFAAGEDDGGTTISTLYINSAGLFNGLPAAVTGIPGFTDGDARWFDYDNDGDLDLIISGLLPAGAATMIMRNDGTAFNNSGMAFRPLQQSAIDIGDLDNDGDQDFVVSGIDRSVSPAERATVFYRNNFTDFSEFPIVVTGVSDGDLALVDYDNDGDLDLAVTGGTGSGGFTALFRNDAGTFVESGETLLNVSSSSIAFADGDSDQDLDLLVTGLSGVVSRTGFYVNLSAVSNALPSAPTIVTQSVSGNRVTLTWNGASDPNQNNAALTYNLRVGTAPSISDIMNPMAQPTSGKRRVAAPGNVGQRLEWVLNLLDAGTYYWSVQAIDNSFQGSSFPTPGSFTINPSGSVSLIRPNGGERLEIGSFYNISWNSSGIVQVKLQYSLDDGTSWLNIVDQVSASGGFYNWQIPATASDRCLVRISSVSSPSIFDVSDNVFSIGDFTRPNIFSLDYNYNIQFGQDLPVSAGVADNTGLSRVSLFYRQGGAHNFIEIDMNNTGGDSFVGIIPGTEIGPRSIELYIEAEDNFANIARTDTNDVEVFIANGIASPWAFPSGSDVSNYRLFSIPFIMDNKSPQAFLNRNNLGDYDPTRFRWFSANNDALIEFPNFGNLLPGQAWFFITTEPSVAFETGSGHTYSTLDWFTIDLPTNSWTLVGSPYYYNIPFDSLYTDPPANLSIWEFNGSWSLNFSGFEPWKGYAVFSPIATTLYLNPEREGLSKPAAKYSTDQNAGHEWLVRIIADDGYSNTHFNFLGQKTGALDGYDSFDLVHPPRVGDQVQILFDELPELNNRSLIADVRSTGADGLRWDFTTRVKEGSEKFSLQFEGIGSVRQDFRLVLVDEYTGRRYDLSGNPHIEILVKNTPQRDFHILAGTENYLQSQSDTDGLLPVRFALQQNFPNPFNPVTQINFDLPRKAQVTIDIYDTAGRLVHNLLHESLQAGRHSVVWNASSFGSGVYLVRMQAGSYTGTRKIVLIK